MLMTSCVISFVADALDPLFPGNFISTLPDRNEDGMHLNENAESQRLSNPLLATVSLGTEGDVCLDHTFLIHMLFQSLPRSLIYSFFCSKYF